MQDRLKKGRERLGEAIEALALLCEPVEPPMGELEHIHYFCANTEIPSDLKEREPQRAALYKATAILVRARANIADELETAGYLTGDIVWIKAQVENYLNVREIVKRASGESLDLIVKTGIADAIALQLGGLKGNPGAVAETIENNVRRKII